MEVLNDRVTETPTLQRPEGMPGMDDYDFNERPFLVFWEITRSCALACSHCRAEAQSRRHPEELNYVRIHPPHPPARRVETADADPHRR